MKNWKTKSGYLITQILKGRSNVFLLSVNSKNILIDTSPDRLWPVLKRRLYKLGIKNLDYLILTHTHYDHAENSAKLKSEFGAKVIVNKNEAVFLEKGENILPHGTNFLTRFLVDSLAHRYSFKMTFTGCSADIMVDDNFDLRGFGLNGYIISTPGHTSGSQSVIIDDEYAIVGDAMFGVFPQSIFPPFADDEEELIKSWGKLVKTNCKLFLPSHGTPNKADLVRRLYLKKSNSD